MERKICPRCNAGFPCGGLSGTARCWCDEKPWIMPIPSPDAACLCPACLDLEISSASASIRTSSPASAQDAASAPSGSCRPGTGSARSEASLPGPAAPGI
ncbi:MAG TPA: cysteine-rich CWC family protein [Planctomycetota bacterium]|nr:cysteine-rich CWC family protein [Planctomycetota bacterium]